MLSQTQLWHSHMNWKRIRTHTKLKSPSENYWKAFKCTHTQLKMLLSHTHMKPNSFIYCTENLTRLIQSFHRLSLFTFSCVTYGCCLWIFYAEIEFTGLLSNWMICAKQRCWFNLTVWRLQFVLRLKCVATLWEMFPKNLSKPFNSRSAE